MKQTTKKNWIRLLSQSSDWKGRCARHVRYCEDVSYFQTFFFFFIFFFLDNSKFQHWFRSWIPNLCLVPRPSYSSTVTARHLLGYFFSVLIGERFKLIKIIDNCL